MDASLAVFLYPGKFVNPSPKKGAKCEIQGSLGAYTSQVVNRLDEQLGDMVKAGAGVVKKAVLGEYPGVKKGHFPCLDRGTEGYAAMFRHLLKEGYAN